jgi:hypothetical protein
VLPYLSGEQCYFVYILQFPTHAIKLLLLLSPQLLVLLTVRSEAAGGAALGLHLYAAEALCNKICLLLLLPGLPVVLCCSRTSRWLSRLWLSGCRQHLPTGVMLLCIAPVLVTLLLLLLLACLSVLLQPSCL